jgi:DNA-binding transcriptional LysR family regulator
MKSVHIDAVDLNLLRLFDAVYRTRNVSRAAEALGLTQPAASHGLTRLRLLLGDALFTRAPAAWRPRRARNGWRRRCARRWPRCSRR